MKKLVGVERAVFTANRYFLGRTLWDKSHVLRLNPEATYYYCPDMLRPDFYQASWHLERAQRCLIYTTTTPQFYKGTACLVRALALLERQFPQVRLVIGGPLLGTGVGRYLQRLAQRLRVTGRIEWEGYLGAGRIVKQLQAAHVYVLPSHIENSPNSLTEAQMVGVPCVASYAGGIPSLVQDGESGLLFNVGDPAVLAMNVCRVFEDDLLAERLSRTARERAACRHDPAHVMRTQLEIYQRLLSAGPK
jgi:glycosyltransferase involved in cell wall biosynthesis